jgi:hypothetical protein
MHLSLIFKTPVKRRLLPILSVLILLLTIVVVGIVRGDEQDLQQAARAGIAIWPSWTDPSITTFTN